MSLDEYRHEIDQINKDMLKLHERRLDVVQKVATYKAQIGLKILQPEREKEIIARMCDNSKNEYIGATKVLFNTLMSISREQQYGDIYKNTSLYKLISQHKLPTLPAYLSVACQGVDGSFSTVGANQMFPNGKIKYFPEFENVFTAVLDGTAAVGVLPIENSYSGSVLPVYDLMKKYSFYIFKCQKVKVEHCLLAVKGAKLQDIYKVYSHDQAIRQCSEFLSDRPAISPIVYSNTAAAAKFVCEQGDKSIAAIASSACSDIYYLDILKKEIQNKSENYTRFIAITKEFYLPQAANKISVCLSLPNKEGSLSNILSRFTINGLNLTKIESRPDENINFSFLFFLEFEGNIIDENVKKLICQLSDELEFFVFLGNYHDDM